MLRYPLAQPPAGWEPKRTNSDRETGATWIELTLLSIQPIAFGRRGPQPLRHWDVLPSPMFMLALAANQVSKRCETSSQALKPVHHKEEQSHVKNRCPDRTGGPSDWRTAGMAV
jgi:hypothetical protein